MKQEKKGDLDIYNKIFQGKKKKKTVWVYVYGFE